jgi:hypothetical protein
VTWRLVFEVLSAGPDGLPRQGREDPASLPRPYCPEARSLRATQPQAGLVIRSRAFCTMGCMEVS